MSISIDAFINRWGVAVTLRKIQSAAWDPDYDEYDEGSMVWSDTNIQAWLSPAEGDIAEHKFEGISLEPEDKIIRFKSDQDVTEADYILYETKRYRIARLRKSTYAGFPVLEGLIRLEPEA